VLMAAMPSAIEMATKYLPSVVKRSRRGGRRKRRKRWRKLAGGGLTRAGGSGGGATRLAGRSAERTAVTMPGRGGIDGSSVGGPCIYIGMGTRPRISASTRSASSRVRPSESWCALRTTRCASAAGASSLKSSGRQKLRPSM